MFGRPFGRQRPGRPLMPDAINDPSHAAARHGRLRAASGMAQTMLAGIPLLRGTAVSATSFWARLSSHISLGSYAYTRLVESGTTLVATSDTGVCFDVNGNTTIVTPVIVRVFLDAPSGRYRFQYHSCS